MSAAILPLARTPVRASIALSLAVLATLLLVSPASAAEKKLFDDVVVGRGGMPDSISTVTGNVEVNGRVGGDVETSSATWR